ncbi:MAG: 3-deoxy-7-phosphoheptulonate synthase [Myxococcales bacterium]|nr:3-deoxy-7-phosphoheptulonate synthase [Myxococcales bacterium]
MEETHNLRVERIEPLVAPAELRATLPLSDRSAQFIAQTRRAIEAILEGRDGRRLAIVGPCSIHDPKAALEYARRLAPLRERLADRLLICMRVYFEKPRTTVGWKGLINDPHMDGRCDVATGLLRARALLLQLADMGMPTATETLDPVSPQYLSDLISWTAIGARTTESQTHREMASGLSMPVGFKNGTDGGLTVALNAMQASRASHSFIGIDEAGQVGVVRTAGNHATHVVLRGGSGGPNYCETDVRAAAERLGAAGLSPRVLIDCSHANSSKRHENQPRVLEDVAQQLERGGQAILGVMLESHLVAGRQDYRPGEPLTYGQSIPDACIDFPTTELALERLARAVPAPTRAGRTAVTDL